MKPAYLGEHFIIELYDCSHTILNDLDKVKAIMLHSAELANATVVQTYFHQFSPFGLSGTIVIEESHFNIHTWPEHNFVAIDLFTCGTSITPLPAKDYLVEAFGAGSHDYSAIKRGVLRG